LPRSQKTTGKRRATTAYSSSSRQHAAQTTPAHLHWCGANPPGPWPTQVTGHEGDPPNEFYIYAIFTGFQTTPPFFLNARRGPKVAWEVADDSPIIVNGNGLDASEQANIIPTLLSNDNWILFTHPLGPPKTITPFFPLAPKEYFTQKGMPAGKKDGGRQELTN